MRGQKKEEEKEKKGQKEKAVGKIAVLLLSIVFCSSPYLAQQTKSVFFIGNSYTAANNLPMLVSQIAASTGNNLVYNSHTPGGSQLNQHSANASVIATIANNTWEHVVLQDQSQKPSFGPAFVAANVYPFAKILCDTIRHFDSCTQPVFFMTWGRKNGDPGNCASAPWLCTYQGMDSALADSYNQMGAQNQAFVSPVGAVWNHLVSNSPTINLYTSDNSHPSVAGSFAAACTFYTVFFRENPTAISFNSSLSSSDALAIKNAVKLIVYDSLSKWNIGEYDAVANFGFTQSGNNFMFRDSSLRANSYSWDFGDGNGSLLENPTHTFTSNGTYSVKLVATQCGIKDSVTKTVVVNTSKLVENNKSRISVFPNPSVEGIITVRSEENTLLSVYSVNNALVGTYRIRKGTTAINQQTFNPGMYYLKFDSGETIKWVVYE